MAGALLGIGQAGVGQAQQRSVRLLDQIDLDQARPRRHHLAAVPAEAVGQAVHRHDLAEGAAREASAGDIDEIEPAGLRLDLRLRPHPAQDLLRIGQQGEHRGGRCRDVRLAADDQGVLHRSPPRVATPSSPSADSPALVALRGKMVPGLDGGSDKCGEIRMDSPPAFVLVIFAPIAARRFIHSCGLRPRLTAPVIAVSLSPPSRSTTGPA